MIVFGFESNLDKMRHNSWAPPLNSSLYTEYLNEALRKAFLSSNDLPAQENYPFRLCLANSV